MSLVRVNEIDLTGPRRPPPQPGQQPSLGKIVANEQVRHVDDPAALQRQLDGRLAAVEMQGSVRSVRDDFVVTLEQPVAEAMVQRRPESDALMLAQIKRRLRVV